MKHTIIILTFCICVSGCSSLPKVVNREKLNRISEKESMLTGYHQDYLGSDDQYHYVRVGIVTGDRTYRIKKEELYIISEYRYSKKNPRVENLLYKRGLNNPSNQGVDFTW